MQKITLLSTALLLASTLLTPFEARSDAPVPVILVIDSTKIMDQSTAALSIKEQVEKKRQSFQTEITGYENELRKTNEGLVASQKKLSAGEFAKKKSAFEARVAAVQGIVENKRHALEAAFETAMKNFHDAFQAIMKNLTSEMGANIVVKKETLIYVADGFDATDAALKMLNEKLPKMAISFPSDKNTAIPSVK